MIFPVNLIRLFSSRAGIQRDALVIRGRAVKMNFRHPALFLAWRGPDDGQGFETALVDICVVFLRIP